MVENDEDELRKERLRIIKEERLRKEAEREKEREQRGREIEEEEELVAQKNKKEKLKELHDEIKNKEKKLREIEKEAGEEKARDATMQDMIRRAAIERKERERVEKEKKLDELNELISSALKIIRENPLGIDEETLMKKLETNKENLQKVLPRILRLKNINEEVKLVNGIYKNIIKEVKNTEAQKQIKENKPKFTSKEIRDFIKSRDKCMEVITYKRKKIEPVLIRQLVKAYVSSGSVKGVCKKHPWIDEEKIRRHLPTPARFPVELQKNAHNLLADPESSMAIAMYAVDYYNWDGEKSTSDKVVKLALKLKTGFEKNNDLRLKLMGRIIK